MLLIDEPQPITVTTNIVARRTPLWKRLFDIVGSLGIMIVILPILVIVAAYIKIVSRGPIFFTQDRLGHGGKPFRIFKFRTLRQNRSTSSHREFVKQLDRSKPAAKPKMESQFIKGGQLIRTCSLDELPQLWNVVRGDMSLVGPRPDVLEIEDYGQRDLRRFEVAPGMSGLWQVSGKNRLTYQEMIDLDIKYVDELSPKLDLWIIAKTFGALFQRDVRN